VSGIRHCEPHSGVAIKEPWQRGVAKFLTPHRKEKNENKVIYQET